MIALSRPDRGNPTLVFTALGRMIAGIFIVVILGLGMACAFAEEPVGPEAGHELAVQLISRRPEQNSSWRGTLKITRSEETVSLPVECKTVVEGDNWFVLYETPGSAAIPAEKLVVEFSTNHPPVYHYQQAPEPGAALGATNTLHAGQADIAFAGSDFWLSDLAFEFFHWPDQYRRKGIVRRTRPCFVMESNRSKDSKTVYSRVVTWIERESGMPLEARAFGEHQDVIKDFELGSVGKVNGRYQVKSIKMYDRRTDGRHSFIDFDFNVQK
jgi:hypothetical protein